MNGKPFSLLIKFNAYYGHDIKHESETIFAVWDSVNKFFYEFETGLEVDEREIVMWWKE